MLAEDDAIVDDLVCIFRANWLEAGGRRPMATQFGLNTVGCRLEGLIEPVIVLTILLEAAIGRKLFDDASPLQAQSTSVCTCRSGLVLKDPSISSPHLPATTQCYMPVTSITSSTQLEHRRYIGEDSCGFPV